MIDIGLLLQPADGSAASPAASPTDFLPHHAHMLVQLCGEFLQQTGAVDNEFVHPGHLLVLSRKADQDHLFARYAPLGRADRSGTAEPLANLLDHVGNQYEAGRGPLRRDPGETYVAMAMIVHGIEGILPATSLPAGELLTRVRAGELSAVTRGVGLSVDGHRAYTWITPATQGVQGWLLQPGDAWPEHSPYVPAAVCLHERLSAP